ncbi:MAG: class I SAM-dependent methyltransferase [Ignavibacteriaceae bacterium]|nr:class I SAM-dependent methyltransferase [Ignavibacteriaceae bacterium]
MRQAFDTVAQSYDASFTHSVIGTAQRNVVWSYLERALSSNDELNILELNCGTGEDALWFGRKGHRLLATDISDEMLTITRMKIENAGLASHVETLKIDINKIEQLEVKEKFDLIFSNFGGMNCISAIEMRQIPSALSRLLNANGRLIMIIMPRYCLWETSYFLIKLNFKKAFRRYSNGTIAKLNELEFRTYYYTPNQMKKIFAKYFDVVNINPVGFFIPPSYLEKFFAPKVKTFNFLRKMENFFSNQSILAGFSDHFLIDLQVKK